MSAPPEINQRQRLADSDMTPVHQRAASLPPLEGEQANVGVPQAPERSGVADSLTASSQAAHLEKNFRPDIEGLRAVAVLAVVLYHAGLGWMHGGFIGVDVFFVISGFLITSQLVGEARRTGRVRLREFWARRARRLLPAVALVLAATTVAVILNWQVLRRARALTDIAVAALYGANWRFIADGVQYGSETQPSPVLHLWSLGVEEQFYLIWPLLVLAALVIARRTHLRFTRVLVPAMVAIWLGSFGLSLYASTHAPMFAYFSLPTRAWQLGTGALLALTVVRWGQLPARLRAVAGWLGLAAIVLAVFSLTEGGRTPYPGWVGLLPTFGAAAVIASGLGGVPAVGPTAVLRLAPMQFMGKLSYGWYLWHWPVLILTPSIINRPLTVTEKLLASAAALLVAWLSFRLVENPVRHSRALAPRPMISLALGAALTVLPAIVAWQLVGSAAKGAVTNQIAVAVDESTSTSSATRQQSLINTPLEARDDRGLVTDPCQVDRTKTQPLTPCVFGATESTQRMVLIGDSHASQWFPALEQVAADQGYALTAWTKAWCQVAEVNQTLEGKPYPACAQWRENVLQQVEAMRPQVIVVAAADIPGATYHQAKLTDEAGKLVPAAAVDAAWRAGFARTLQRLKATGAQVVVIRDTPNMRHQIPECLANTGDARKCSTPRSKAVSSGVDAEVAREQGVQVWDFTDSVCTAKTCQAIVGDHIAWWDHAHLTGRFVRTLAPVVEEAFVAGVKKTG